MGTLPGRPGQQEYVSWSRAYIPSHSHPPHPHTHTLTLTLNNLGLRLHTFTLTPCHPHILTLSHPHSHPHTHILTHILTYILTHSSHSHPHVLTHILTLTSSHSHPHTSSLTSSHVLTLHPHTHILTPSHSPLLTVNSTGTHSVYTVFEGHEIMFHVSTLLPYTSGNKQQVHYIIRQTLMSCDVHAPLYSVSSPSSILVLRGHILFCNRGKNY